MLSPKTCGSETAAWSAGAHAANATAARKIRFITLSFSLSQYSSFALARTFSTVKPKWPANTLYGPDSP